MSLKMNSILCKEDRLERKFSYFANLWRDIGSRRRTYIWSSWIWKRHMTKYQRRSCVRRRRNTKFQQSTLPLTRDMYDNVVTSVRADDSDIDTFLITIGLHQGLAMNPYMFSLVNVAGWGHKGYRKRYSLVYALCWWWCASRWDQGWRNSWTMTDYLRCNFSGVKCADKSC
jgi:hypothetical protein